MHPVPCSGGRGGALLRGALALLAVFLLIVAVSAAPAPGAGTDGTKGSPAVAPFRDGEVIVGFKHVPSHDYQAADSPAMHANAVVGAKVKKDFTRFGLEGVQLVQLPPGLTVASAVASFRADPAVRYAEPNYLLHADAVPNDMYYSTQWAHHSADDHDIDTPEAWDITTGSSSVVVAVVDSGIDYTHDELAPNIWTNAGETPGNGVDDDGNGYVDDVRGWDFANDDNDPIDDQSHGSHCAGIIGAVGNNGWGVAGTMWQVRLMPLKFLDSEGEGDTADGIEAVLYARAKGVPIISCSFGDDEYSQAFKDAIDGTNALFPCAAGNGDGFDGWDNDVIAHYPSSYESSNIIAVAATDEEDRLVGFSNYGLTTVDLGAPGNWIYSTVRNPSYDYMSGTSMATPFVAGVAGLVRAREPGISVGELKARILRGVEPIPSLDGRVATCGRLNAYRAVLPSPPPIAWFMTNTTGGEVPLTVRFDDRSAGLVTSWSWNFGDGGTSAERNPVHVYSTPGAYTVSLTACNAAGACDTKTRVITVWPEDFLAVALEAPGHPWTTGGNASWEYDYAVSHDGVDSARSGPVGALQRSGVWTTVTVTGDADSVSFWWKVSSEVWDYLRFYDNGAQQLQISGEVDWSRQEYSLTPGTHTLIWVYEKDFSVTKGDDAGWLDQVTVTGDTKPDLAPLAFTPPSGAVARTFTISNAVRNNGAAASGPFAAGFYLSSDTTITTADTPIGTRGFTGLDAGAATPGEATTVTIPASVPAGAYYLGMIVDPANAVEELDEANNACFDPDTITITAPPPTVAGITPNTGIQGTTVAITDLAGSGFAPDATVTLTRAGSAEIAATDVAVVSPTKITCNLGIPPTATTGAWNVTVENPDGRQGILAGGFTVGPSSAVLPVPGGTGIPTDTDGDRLYDDVNGNGRADFADIVLYFNQMTWVTANEPLSAFDFNGNGRIDFADVVWLFNNL